MITEDAQKMVRPQGNKKIFSKIFFRKLLSIFSEKYMGLDDISQIEDKKMKIKAKIRSTQEPKLANLFLSNQQLCINFYEDVEGVSPGQACVFYDANNSSRVLGGGWITQ